MASDPIILATSGGLVPGHRTSQAFGPLMNYATELAEVSGRTAKWCQIGTAMGDQRWLNDHYSEAAIYAGVELTHLNIFPKVNVEDIRAHLLAQDVIWVHGGSIENLLVLWRLHGIDTVLAECWERGIVLAGTSAGSICWHVGATTNLVGPPGEFLDNGLGFLPYSNAVHYNVELERRERYKAQVADGRLGDGHAVDDGAGLVYRGTDLVEAVCEVEGRHAYSVKRQGDKAVETALATRLLHATERAVP